MSLRTPVVFAIFNRPHTTKRVFDEIARAKPQTLFIIADGPRLGHPDDVENVARTRAIAEQIDWDCDVKRNYAETNMGLKSRISSGLNWVFETAEEAIILEDDCLPHHTFFPYCEELLTYYRDNQQIVHIGGSNFLFGALPIKDSYYFSRYPHVWGWATWRRAWSLFDLEMTKWLEDPERILSQFEDAQEREFWRSAWNRVHAGQLSSWAFVWVLACYANDSLCINPSINLISNIGFGPGAVHTTDEYGFGNNLPVGAMPLPLKHPGTIACNTQADQIVAERFFERRSELQSRVDELTQQLRILESDRAAYLQCNQTLKTQLDELRNQVTMYEDAFTAIRKRKIVRLMKSLGKPLV